MNKTKVYFICPVTNATKKQKIEMDACVQLLESTGHEVYYPPRDVDQRNDNGGLRIFESHLNAMRRCVAIYVWWDIESKGSYFDLGMAYMLYSIRGRLPCPMDFFIANKDGVEPLKNKSYQNLLIQLAEETHESQSNT